MQSRQLGQTEISIPEIGLGTSRYEGYIELIRKAVELGAVLVDTAESYGNEEILGQAIKGLRGRVFVATKTNHWRYEEVLRSAEASLGKLGVDCIDLYQLHYPNVTVPIAETMGAMEDLVDQGKVRFIGVSNFHVHDLKKAQRAMRRHRIVSNQIRYSLVDRTVERDVFPYCQKSRITLIAYSPLGTNFRTVREADREGALETVSKMTDKSEVQVALNWCLSKPGVVVIPRTTSEKHLVENCGSSGWNLTEEQVALLDRGIRFLRRSRVELAIRRGLKGLRQRMESV